jgi:Zn-dependent protease with chaperone function
MTAATAPPAQSRERIEFPGLSPSAFEHPMDRTALDALRRTPGLDLLFKKLGSLHFERIVRLHYTADSLRLSPTQCPRIYNLLLEASATLDMKPPDLYLLQSPIVNAFAIGMERHTIVLFSGLVDLLDEDELRYVIGHELGHIKSGHMLYRTMAIFLGLVGLVAARNLPFVNLLSQAMLYALYDWTRKSELTADRAGLLVAQDPDVGIRTLMKLAGGAIASRDALNVDEFLKQADDYEDMGANLLDALYQLSMTLEQTHPFPAVRARELRRWSETEDYRAILRGEYLRSNPDTDRRCGKCGALVENPLFRFCPDCGATL